MNTQLIFTIQTLSATDRHYQQGTDYQVSKVTKQISYHDVGAELEDLRKLTVHAKTHRLDAINTTQLSPYLTHLSLKCFAFSCVI